MNTAPLHGALGDVLMQVAGELEVLGSGLCADPALAENHLTGLQKLDWCAQSLVQLAQVIAAPDPASAVTGITLGDLRSRLISACPDQME